MRAHAVFEAHPAGARSRVGPSTRRDTISVSRSMFFASVSWQHPKSEDAMLFAKISVPWCSAPSRWVCWTRTSRLIFRGLGVLALLRERERQVAGRDERLTVVSAEDAPHLLERLSAKRLRFCVLP